MRGVDELGVVGKDMKTMAVEVIVVSLLLTIGVFRTLLWCLCLLGLSM